MLVYPTNSCSEPLSHNVIMSGDEAIREGGREGGCESEPVLDRMALDPHLDRYERDDLILQSETIEDFHVQPRKSAAPRAQLHQQ